MALSVLLSSKKHGEIDQNFLVQDFVQRFDPSRGYGATMGRFLREVGEGRGWREWAPALFDGQGSRGNGAAMRVAPIGAFFADDLERVVQEAEKSAVTTHTHSEAVAGAIAVAVAAALCSRGQASGPLAFLQQVADWTPESTVKQKILKALAFPATASLPFVVSVLGNGETLLANDTVPFCLWVAARHLKHYEEALWLTVSAGGDRDTNCAIVGGIVGAGTEVPEQWLAHAEPVVLDPLD